MKYLQRAYDLAEARGYFHYPEVVAMLAQVPSWFARLGTNQGGVEFEAHYGVALPMAMREFYACPLLACFLETTMDGEVFLNDLASFGAIEMPPVVEWSGRSHLVFSFHGHSGAMYAALLGDDDPPVFCGFNGDSEPMTE
jgi:hypothetical protein